MDQAVAALFRPRHLLVTLLVALATGAVGVTVAATDVGEEAVPPDPWVGDFATPLPHVGDQGRYVVDFRNRDDGYWPDEVTFAWLPDGEAFNATGARLVANRLALKWIDDDADLLVLEPGTNQELGRSQVRNETSTDPAGGPLDPGQTSTDTSRTWSFQEGRSATLWCGIRTPLQGRSIRLTDQVEDGTDCWNGPHSWATDGYAVLVRSVGGQAPHRVAVVDSYQAEDLERKSLYGSGANPFMRSTYLEGFPYAVRVEFMSGQLSDAGYSAAYNLSAYTLGSVPIANERVVLAPAPAPMTLAPMTETGPDASGFVHPYTLERAWARARGDPGFNDLQDYLRDHPGAYIGQAASDEMVQDGRTTYAWYIVLTDGVEQYAFRAMHTPGPAEGIGPVDFPVGLPVGLSAGDTYDRLTNGWEDGPFPLPADRPSVMPTVASQVATWSALTGRHDANTYGFDLRCWDDGRGNKCQTKGQALVGASSDVTNGTPALGYTRTIEDVTLQVDGEGRLVALDERQQTQGANDPLGDPAPTGAAPQVEEMTVLPSSSWRPTPREAVAIGGAAVLATLAYWLWPLAKGGGAGLFSRVHKDRLLDNTLRQRLVQRIEAEPGIHHNALVRDLGKGKGAAEHHLEKLVAARLVLRHRGTGYTCYFPAGTDHRTMAAVPATKADGARQVLEALRNGVPGVRGIAIATGLAPSTVSHHLDRLRAAGLVVGDGRTGYHAVPGRDGPVAAA